MTLADIVPLRVCSWEDVELELCVEVGVVVQLGDCVREGVGTALGVGVGVKDAEDDGVRWLDGVMDWESVAL